MLFIRTRIILSFLLLFFSLITAAQDSSHVKWTASAKKTGEGQYILQLKGTISPEWHVYGKDWVEEGVTGVQIVFPDSSIQLLNSPVIAGNVKKINDAVFGNKAVEVFEENIEFSQSMNITGEIPSKLKLTVTYNAAHAEAFLPEEQKIEVSLEGGVDRSAANRIVIPTIDLNNPVNSCGGVDSISGDLLKIFLLGFVGGLVALITPCVFPMIPLTVSFFTKKAVTKKKGIFNAVTYGFFIFLIYILLSVPFYFIDTASPEILNAVSTNHWLNIGFFAVFLFFAFSFFGYYEITLPSSFSGKADSKAGTGNIVGIFFMALTLAIVSFSCTGPILGSLLVGSLDGGAVQLTAGMGGFGLALALPFALFALFPNWLNSLPKSGGWLNAVKVVLGFIEVGLAFKFLSNADLVKHWGLLKREVFIGIWVLIGIGITLYLLGKIRFPHDKRIKKISKVRMSFAVWFGLFTIYLIPGLTNTKWANLSLISGFPPPLCYSIYEHPVNCEDFEPLRDYEEALVKAKAENKPILIDFTGFACVNCRRMEENVWSREDVKEIMKDKYVVVSLYVDDKKKLPASKQFIYTTKDGIEKDIISVGDKWATFQTENFKNNAQPLYAILSPHEILLTKPIDYSTKEKFKNWLECGLEAFRKVSGK